MAEVRIIIIDDGIRMCETLSDIFEEKGYLVSTANTGADGVKKAETTTFDIAFIDIKLPDMDGIDIIGKLNASNPEIVCMLITGHASRENAIRGLKAGAADYFIKPLDITKVLLRVEQAMEKVNLQRSLWKEKEFAVAEKKKFADAINALSDIFIVFDLDGNLKLWNDTLEHVTGNTKKLLADMNVTDLFAEEESNKVSDTIVTTITEGSHSIELNLAASDRETIPCLFRTSRLLDVNGLAAGITGIGHDITEKKKAEKKLNNVNRLYATLSQVNQTIVRERDKNELFQNICDIAIKFGGFRLAWIGFIEEESQLVIPAAFSGEGSDYLQNLTISLADDLTARGPTGRSIREGKSVVFNDLATNPDYEPWREQALAKGYRSSAAFPIRSNGRVIGALNIYAVEPHFFDEAEINLLDETAMDISFALLKFEEEDKRRRAEAELRNLAKVFLESCTPTVIEDMNGIIRKVNNAAVTVYGWNREELIGESIKKLIPDNTKEKQGETLHERCRRGALIRDVEGIRRHKNGTHIPVLLTLSLLTDDDNNPTGIVTHATDITDQKNAEEEREKLQAQFLQAQKLEAIGILAGGVAHDFNNLLTAIIGNVDLVLHKIDAANPLRRKLIHVQEAGNRAAALTRQLLLYSRKQPLSFTTFNINDTVNNLLSMVHRLIGEDITIESNLCPDLWFTRADEGNIEQVIMNLAVNARDAMPNGGKLSISTDNTIIDNEYCKSFSYAAPGSFIHMTIADTGRGMNEETMLHIFEPFFTTKGLGKGTGLGMSVVYGIIRKHEGWVNVHSRVGQGTIFDLYLPASLDHTEVIAEEEVSLEEYRGNDERILLVEDEETVREYCATVLEEHGYRVVAAENAEEALEIFEKERGVIDLIFTDVVLAEHDGIQLVSKLISLKPDLRMLLSSGYTDSKSQWSVIQERGYPFLQKPYAAADLLRTVHEIFSQ